MVDMKSTRKKGKWEVVGCEASEEGGDGPHGSQRKGYSNELERYSKRHQEWCEY